MDKVIVVFGRSGYHTSLRPISLGLADGFRELGRRVAFCDCDDWDSINACFELFAAGQVAFGIGLNGCGMTWNIEGVGEVNLHEKYDVPHVSVMLDLPYNKCATGMEKPCARHIVTLLVIRRWSICSMLIRTRRPTRFSCHWQAWNIRMARGFLM